MIFQGATMTVSSGMQDNCQFCSKLALQLSEVAHETQAERGRGSTPGLRRWWRKSVAESAPSHQGSQTLIKVSCSVLRFTGSEGINFARGGEQQPREEREEVAGVL